MELETTKNYLTGRDLEKLKEIQKHVCSGVACSFEKARCEEYLETLLNPKCSVCRKPLEDKILIVNDHKMHPKCRKKYLG